MEGRNRDKMQNDQILLQALILRSCRAVSDADGDGSRHRVDQSFVRTQNDSGN